MIVKYILIIWLLLFNLHSIYLYLFKGGKWVFEITSVKCFWHWLHTHAYELLCLRYNFFYKLIIFLILILSKNADFNERKKSLILRINTFLFKWHQKRKTSRHSVTSVIYLRKKSNNHFNLIIALVWFLIYNKLLSYNFRSKNFEISGSITLL